MKQLKIKSTLLAVAIFFSQNLVAKIDESAYKSIAEGVLAISGISPESITILEVKPYKNNNTILQIGYKSKNTNEINIVYALSDNSILVGGQLIEKGMINDTFNEKVMLKNHLNFISKEALVELKKYSTLLVDNKDSSYKKEKENLYITISPMSVDFDLITQEINFNRLNSKYNVFLIPVNTDNRVLLKSSQLLSDKTELKALQENNLTKLVTDKKIDTLNEIVDILEAEGTLSLKERLGLEPIYFIGETRVEPRDILANTIKESKDQ